MTNIWAYFLVSLCGTYLAITLYNWVKAERDEREWRKLLAEEMNESGSNAPIYRLVRDHSWRVDDGEQ